MDEWRQDAGRAGLAGLRPVGVSLVLHAGGRTSAQTQGMNGQKGTTIDSYCIPTENGNKLRFLCSRAELRRGIMTDVHLNISVKSNDRTFLRIRTAVEFGSRPISSFIRSSRIWA
jgi:hypothetical protein